MTTITSEKEIELVRRMANSREKAEWGFELILEKRGDRLEDFFDILFEYGLFDPASNLGPIPAKQEGYVQIPFWAPLNYLKALTEQVVKNNNVQIINKILAIIREVTNYKDENGKYVDNYHTYHYFSEIYGLIPPSFIPNDDLLLIKIWIRSEFDNGLVVSAIDKGLLRNSLASNLAEELDKAEKILLYLSAIKPYDSDNKKQSTREKRLLVDDHWYKQLLDNNIDKIGEKIPEKASIIFQDNLKLLYPKSSPSSWARPAIEVNEQNHGGERIDNIFVDAIRDLLIIWSKSGDDKADSYIEKLYDSEFGILRRIAFYITNARWDSYKNIFASKLNENFLQDDHLHELYGLFKNHFKEFSDSLKSETLNLIKNMTIDESIENSDKVLLRDQRVWLSSLIGQGCDEADNWFKEIDLEHDIGKLSDHPDFHSYMYSWSGPGESPFSKAQLRQLFQKGKLVKVIDEFEETDSWFGPTKSALVNTLAECVSEELELFFKAADSFIRAQYCYKYALFKGFKDRFEKDCNNNTFDWASLWDYFFSYAEKILDDDDLWNDTDSSDFHMTPTNAWIPPLISEILRMGTRKDENAYPFKFLPRGENIIIQILNNTEIDSDFTEDAIQHAINSTRGKTIEALYDHALRACRVSDKKYGNHENSWDALSSYFDDELGKCINTNFDFSALTGQYLPNLLYLNESWLRRNIKKIFPEKYESNILSAVNGLAYSGSNKAINRMLLENGIFDQIIQLPLEGRNTENRVLERLALSYLWGDEELNSSRFKYIYINEKTEFLKIIIKFFWSVNNQDLEADYISRIFSFWKHTVKWLNENKNHNDVLSDDLSLLACYVENFNNGEAELLLYSAPYVYKGYEADRFIEQLSRLLDMGNDPVTINNILKIILQKYRPTYDYQDGLLELIRKISLSDQHLKLDAIKYTNELRYLKKMKGLHKDLSESN